MFTNDVLQVHKILENSRVTGIICQIAFIIEIHCESFISYFSILIFDSVY